MWTLPPESDIQSWDSAENRSLTRVNVRLGELITHWTYSGVSALAQRIVLVLLLTSCQVLAWWRVVRSDSGEVMLSIGEFARLGGVSARTLRHYDDLGLLRPAQVDEAAGRRRYEIDQLGDLNRIVTLNHLGFSLQEVGEFVRDGVEAAELRGMLRMRRAELELQMRDAHQRIAQIDGRLRLIESLSRAARSSTVRDHD